MHFYVPITQQMADQKTTTAHIIISVTELLPW